MQEKETWVDKLYRINIFYNFIMEGGRVFMKVKALDRKFDEGESIVKHIDPSKARRPNQEQKRISVNLPFWMIQSLDKAAKRLGVPRQAIIKIWLTELQNYSNAY